MFRIIMQLSCLFNSPIYGNLVLYFFKNLYRWNLSQNELDNLALKADDDTHY